MSFWGMNSVQCLAACKSRALSIEPSLSGPRFLSFWRTEIELFFKFEYIKILKISELKIQQNHVAIHIQQVLSIKITAFLCLLLRQLSSWLFPFPSQIFPLVFSLGVFSLSIPGLQGPEASYPQLYNWMVISNGLRISLRYASQPHHFLKIFLYPGLL